MTITRDTMAKIRGRVSVYKFTAIYACIMLTLIFIAMITGVEVDVR